jgi:hypothetical protein
VTGKSPKWTERDVSELIDVGRRVARLILGRYAPFLACDIDEKAKRFLSETEETKRRLIDEAVAILVEEGMTDALARTHADGALMLMKAGHPLDPEADRLRRN